MSAPQFVPQQVPQQPQYPAPVGQPAYQPQYPGVPPQGYPPQSVPQPQQPVYGQQPQFAPAGGGWPQGQLAPAPQPLAQGSIDDFYSQPSTGGAFLKFNAPGDTYVGIVAHKPGKGDVRQITTPPNQGSVPQFYRDGRPKYEMLVTLKMQPTQDNPEGVGIFPVKGADRDELARAMAEVGAPEGPPEAGALMQITFTHQQATRGGIPRKVKQITYVRPDQAGSANLQQTEAPATQLAQPQQFAPQGASANFPQQYVGQQPMQPQQVAQQFPGSQFVAQAQPEMQQVAQGQGVVDMAALAAAQAAQQGQPQQQAQVQQPVQQPQGQPAAAAVPGMPPGMTQQQQELLKSLGA